MVGANHEQHTLKVSNTKNVLVGLLIGGLAGAAAMLLFAPQIGETDAHPNSAKKHPIA
jgi:gas vesicle protein